jgi:hypothetical protein
MLYAIPPDIYEAVRETILAIVNATESGDDVLRSVYYEQLREFCEAQTTAGRDSGFMWEALADVTADFSERLSYYERALALARRNSEPLQTVLLEIGLLHAEADQWLRAEPFLTEAQERAEECGDIDTEAEASSLLTQIRNRTRPS